MKRRIMTVILMFLVSLLRGQTIITAGGNHSLALCADNTAKAWGQNASGQLGNGTTNTGGCFCSTTFVPVNGLTGVIAIAGGGGHSLALKNDGTVWAWGSNSKGQLGDGTNGGKTSPVQVNGLTGVMAIAGGGDHSLALKNDGTVWAWGSNSNGQLGNGTTTNNPNTLPIQVNSLTGIIAITGGGSHSLALKNDGTVWAWGWNSVGQLGNNSFTDSPVPVQVSGLTGITAIAGGEAHSLALKNNGTVWTWGFNSFGQLGNNSFTDSPIPVQVNNLTGITAIAGGDIHSLALKNNGTVQAWGGNVWGQIDGTFTDKPTPVQISGLTGITAIATGIFANHSFALKNDGTVWAWGFNSSGQLGDGTTITKTSPVQITGICNQVTTGSIAGSTFCGGAVLPVPFVATGSFNGGNIFTAQLSNASGSFAAPVTIGTIASATSGSINATIPLSIPSGSGYRIRVIASSPSTTGTDNGSNITINPAAHAGIITGTSPLCIGQTPTYTTVGDPGGVWSSSNPSVATVQPATGVITAVSAGTTDIIYVVGTVCPDTSFQTLTVNPSVAAGTVSGISPLCIGSAITYSSDGTPGGGWSSTNPSVANVNSLTGEVTALSAGATDITYTVANGCGSPVSSFKPLLVNSNVTAGIISGISSLCIGASSVFTSDGTAGGEWSSAHSSIAGVNTLTGEVTALSAGTTDITYTITSGCGSPVSASTSLMILQKPAVSSISFTNPTACNDSNGTITLTGLNANTSYTLAYSYNDTFQGTIPVTTNASGTLLLIHLRAGTYNGTLTFNNCTSDPVGPVTLSDPLPPVITSVSSNSPVCEGGDIELSASATPGASYSWSGPDGFSSSQQNPVINNAQLASTGIYSLTVTLNGCMADSETMVTMNTLDGLSNGLVGQWLFNGNFNDQTGHANNGTGFGSLSFTTGADGISNGALQFNGSSYVVINDNSLFHFGTGDFTYSVWLKWNTGNLGNIFDKGFSCCAPFTGLQCFINHPSNGLIQGRTDFNHSVSSSGSFGDNNWHHIVYTRSGSSMKIYLDGMLNNSSTQTIDNITNSIDIFIGRNSASGMQFYIGSMDNLRLYNRALNSAEVSGLFSNELNGLTSSAAIFYADADGDGYGNPLVFQQACSPPSGYVSNNLDCNDADSLEYPGQVWYIDNDDDGYGTGASITQCSRPAHGYLVAELTATSGDCNDNNPNINPAYEPSFSFTNATGFTTSACNPLTGGPAEVYQFHIKYTNPANLKPAGGYPRLMLDYENNGVFTNSNDMILFMTETDPNDINMVDGKVYAVAVQGLALGTNWKANFIVIDEGACTTQAQFDGPDVITAPNISIFANDISFSNNNPAPGSSITVSAVIHNNLPMPVQNFTVHLKNHFDTTQVYPDITVATLPGNSVTSVSWTIATPLIPTWVPMEVIIDYNNDILETNELDNSAIRPFVNGNFSLPGGIHATASAAIIHTPYSDYVQVSGDAHYYGTAVPLPDSSVAGATVTVFIVETGQTFTGHTIANGSYMITYSPPPGIPMTYHVQVSITDFTLTDNATSSFVVDSLPPPGPDLVPCISLNQPEVFEGGTVSGTVTVTNIGVLPAGSNSVKMSVSGNMPSPGTFPVPALAPGQSHSVPFSVVFPDAGSFSINAQADPDHLVVESNENNNFTRNACVGSVLVCPLLPDLAADYPSLSPFAPPQFNIYRCHPVKFQVANSTCLPVNTPFAVKAEVFQNSNLVATQTQIITQTIPRKTVHNGTVDVVFNNLFPAAGVYDVHFSIDTDNAIAEVTEANNVYEHSFTVMDCKPDLALTSCPSIAPADPLPAGNVTVSVVISNTGQATAIAPFTVDFEYGGMHYPVTINSDIAQNSSVQISSVMPTPSPACDFLRLYADAGNVIDEDNENNNKDSLKAGWDFRLKMENNFTSFTAGLNQQISFKAGLINDNSFIASQVQTKFEVAGPGISGFVNLGNATANNIGSSCNGGKEVALPTPFTFTQTGTYQFRLTTDINNAYPECDETNNQLIITYTVVNQPDYRILSQHIAPSTIKPDTNQLISINITYENIGASSILDSFNILVIADTTPVEKIRVKGLLHGTTNTVQLANQWSSPQNGLHILRAIADVDNEIAEPDKSNNIATRAINVCTGNQDVALPDFTFIQNGASLSFQDLSQHAVDYLWDFGDGTSTSQVLAVKTYSQPGVYYVKLTVGNSCGGIFKTDTVTVPGISDVKGNKGHDSAIVTVNIYGIGFENGATVSLVNPAFQNINADNVEVLSPQKIRCRFNLTGQPLGMRDVRVSLPTSTVYTKASAFEIIHVEPYRFNVSITGQKTGRRNVYIPTPVNVSNVGTEDAVGLLYITKQSSLVGRDYRNISVYDYTQSPILDSAYQYLLSHSLDTSLLNFEFIDSNHHNSPTSAFIIPYLQANTTYLTDIYQISSIDGKSSQGAMVRPLMNSTHLTPMPDSTDGRYYIGELLRLSVEKVFNLSIGDTIWYNCFNPRYTAFVNEVVQKTNSSNDKLLSFPACITYMLTSLSNSGCITGLPSSLIAPQIKEVVRRTVSNITLVDDVNTIYERHNN